MFNQIAVAIHKQLSYRLRKMFEQGVYAEDGSWTLPAEDVAYYQNIIVPYEELAPESQQFVTDEAGIIVTIVEKGLVGLIRGNG